LRPITYDWVEYWGYEATQKDENMCKFWMSHWIGPLFREEDSFTHMYLCKFVGLDMEIERREDYFEVFYNLRKLFTIFERLYITRKTLFCIDACSEGLGEVLMQDNHMVCCES